MGTALVPSERDDVARTDAEQPHRKASGPAPRVDRLEHADRDEVRHHRRAADRDERQRDPRDGRDPHRHADVDEDLEEEREDDPSGDHRPVEVPRDGHHAEPAPDDEQVEEQEDRRAEEAALLGERREDEVRRVLGEVVEPRLAGLADAAPVDPAGADRGDRLVEVVREGRRVGVGVREPRQARRLVRLEHLDPRGRRHPDDRGDERAAASATSSARWSQRVPAMNSTAASAAV